MSTTCDSATAKAADGVFIPKYDGKIVFVEARGSSLNSKGEAIPASTYHNGEYICVRHTPAAIYCVSTKGRYESHRVECFPLIGSNTHYEIVEAWDADNIVRDLIDRLEAFAREVLVKRQWSESVYSSAADAARQIRQALKRKSDRVAKDRTAKEMTAAAVVFPSIGAQASAYSFRWPFRTFHDMCLAAMKVDSSILDAMQRANKEVALTEIRRRAGALTDALHSNAKHVNARINVSTAAAGASGQVIITEGFDYSRLLPSELEGLLAEAIRQANAAAAEMRKRTWSVDLGLKLPRCVDWDHATLPPSEFAAIVRGKTIR